MAKLRANKRPMKRKKDHRSFIGTCSNCGNREVMVVKVLNSQMCVADCLIEAGNKLRVTNQAVHALGR